MGERMEKKRLDSPHSSEMDKGDPVKVTMKNLTTLTDFILLGLTDAPEFQVVLFLFLLLTYMFSVIVNKTISFAGCFTQYFLATFLGATEFYLLTAMSYDRYVAICKPLHYTIIMSSRVCVLLVLCSWLAGFLTSLLVILMAHRLNFCSSNVINHYCCDTTPLLKLSCSDTSLTELVDSLLAVLTLVITLVLVMLSYTNIIRTILRFPSVPQRKKASSTCSSHMIVISLSYGSCIFMEIKPSTKDDATFNKGVAVLNSSISPLLNPIIYTLRNRQVKQAFKDLVRKIVGHS
uniref:Olfactory receptor n=1 Tax=Phascolarctos cinereus TaxID=38626 RepID=A0A6P5KJX4_PHACI|nr:olfactory receptor 6C4-like [Phascolarctos cinereus]